MRARRPPPEVRAYWQARLDADADAVVTMMRDRGMAIHRTYTRSGTRWATSDGTNVPPKVAEAVIQHPDVAPVGDALFVGAPSQTFRFLK